MNAPLIPLSPSLAHLRWQRFTDYRHARGHAWVKVLAPEAARVAAELPLAFRQEQGRFILVALVGLAADENQMHDANHRWQGRYVPSAWRTPPFCLGSPEGAKPNQRVLCLERDSPWLSETADEPLLDDQKQLTPAVKEVMAFLTDQEKHSVQTQRAVTALHDAGVLTPWQPEGVELEGLYVIDETAFAKLDDETFARLRKLGSAALAYTQMISSHQLPTLQSRAGESSVALDDLFKPKDDELTFDFDQ